MIDHSQTHYLIYSECPKESLLLSGAPVYSFSNRILLINSQDDKTNCYRAGFILNSRYYKIPLLYLDPLFSLDNDKAFIANLEV